MRRKTALFILSVSMLIAMIGGTILAAPMGLRIGTGGTAGISYPLGTAIAGIWAKDVADINPVALVSGGSIENVRLLGQKELEFGLNQNSISQFAFEGTQQFKGQAVTNLRGIGCIMPQPLHIIVRAGSGITSVTDLKGKRVAIGSPGSSDQLHAQMFLADFGITVDDFKPFYLSYADAANFFKDRMIDCAIFNTGLGTSAIQDIASTQNIDIVAVDEAALKAFSAKNPAFISFTIPAGTYRGVNKDVKTISTMLSLYTRVDLPENVIYAITKSLVEKLPEIHNLFPATGISTAQTILNGMSVPLHPGAERYYKEKGLLK